MNLDAIKQTAQKFANKKGPRSKMTPELRQAIASLRSSGLTYRQIFLALQEHGHMPWKTTMSLYMAWKKSDSAK